MSQVLQTLTDFEDSIAAEFDHYRVKNLGLYTKDLEELRHLEEFQQKTMRDARKARQAQFLAPFTSTLHLLQRPMKMKIHKVEPSWWLRQNSMKEADELLPDSYAVIQRPPSQRRATPQKATSEEPGSSALHEQSWLIQEDTELLPEPIPEAERFVPRQRKLPRPVTLPSPALSARLGDRDIPSQQTGRGKSLARPNVGVASLEAITIRDEADRKFATEDTVVTDRGQKLVTKRERRDARDSGLAQSLSLRKSRTDGRARQHGVCSADHQHAATSVRQEATLADDPQPNEGDETPDSGHSWISTVVGQYMQYV